VYNYLYQQTKGSHSMTYTIRLETYNGSVKNIQMPSRGAVAQFISQYPNQLPVGVSVKVSCDLLGVRGTLRGALRGKAKR
jgi:hypothetical protein